MRILVAEVAPDMNRLIVKTLKKSGYSVDACLDGEEALSFLAGADYDALILDVMMPKLDGFALLARIRAEGNTTPALCLTARDAVADRVKGLDLGADDYLVKPFDFEELLARIRAMTRQGSAQADSVLRFGNLSLNQATMELAGPEASFRLGGKEYQLMELFMSNPGITFSADSLLERVWGCDSDAEVGSVWVYISYLRKKLTALDADVEIRSKRGLGYSLEVLK